MEGRFIGLFCFLFVIAFSFSQDLSPVEQRFYEKLKDIDLVLKQFGYELFERELYPEVPLPVGEDYILGPGDELIVYFWGDPVDVLGLESVYKTYVDREGRVFIPHVGAIYVWGKSLKEAEREMRRLLSRKFRNFRVELSLGSLRSLPVYLSGFVNNPGVVFVPATASLIEALVVGGGIPKNGSLRNIILRRAKGGETKIDLYDFLLKGKPLNIFLKDGDVIYVEKLGSTVGVAGSVKRPAIYEIKEGDTIESVIELAGGVLFSAYTYNVKLFRYEDGALKVYNGTLLDREFLKKRVKDGDLILVEELYKLVENYVEVKGHVKYPGKYSVEKFPELSFLIEVAGLLPDTNLYYGEIIRKDTVTGKTEVINFSPKKVKDGEENYSLRPFDVIVFYPEWLYTPITVSGEVENPGIVPYYPGITLLDLLREFRFRGDFRELKALVFSGKKEETENDELLLEKVAEEPEREASRIIYLYDLFVEGEGNITLLPGTKILIERIHPNEKLRTVTILGEVNKPGKYRLEEGMTLYDLIVRAGGYTERAFPKGLIFIRESAKKLQEEHLRLAITTLEESLLKTEEGLSTAGGAREELEIVKLTLARQKELLKLIKEKAKIGLGRIALEIPESLEELKNHPSNIPLEDGDLVFVPARPNYVLVLGDVYNQISLPYRREKPLKYYLDLVGGATPTSDLENMYVIKANGTVISRRNYGKFFSFEWEDGKLYFARDFMDMKLEEGDTIVIPSKVKVPVMWRPLIRDVVQIIFQAVSTAVLAKRL